MELEADCHRAPLFLLKIIVFPRREWQRSEHESYVCQEFLVVDP
jgi:hypothetical protein